jgi:DNA helicase-2/ATP-dependent DNA helicase PcrA
MVDEYQDTNRIQGEIIALLGGVHRNVMVVGDDSQSIYSFRGACFRNIMDFPRQFLGTRILTLEENYRSTQPILDLTNEIIGRAPERYSKHLWTTQSGGSLPALIQAPTEQDQSRFICQRVLELREEGIPLHEIAVLFRSSYHSFDLEVELARCAIPFEKRGGFKFLETLHVKDVLAHLRVFANPRDTVSWNRLLLLIEGVGPKRSQMVLNRLSQAVDTLDIAERLQRISEEIGLSRPLGELVHLFKEVSPDRMTPPELLGHIYSYYLPLLKQRHDDYPKRMRDLEHLYTMAEQYGRLVEFLSDMALEPPEGSVVGVEPGRRDEDERLILSTIHSAKGL